jgi:hypothetical protein
MKRSFFVLLGIGIALSLFATPVLAEDAEALVSAEPEAEVSSCNVADPEERGCTAEQDCPYDEPVDCEGTFQCNVYPYAVQCDLKWYHCQCEAAPGWCEDPLCYCECKEGGQSDAWCRKECCMEWP